MQVTDVLAVARLVRLVRRDEITRPLREELFVVLMPDEEPPAGWEWDDWAAVAPSRPWLVRLLSCSWCVAVWVALLAVLARRVCPKGWRVAADVLGLAYAAAVLDGASHAYAEGR